MPVMAAILNFNKLVYELHTYKPLYVRQVKLFVNIKAHD